MKGQGRSIIFGVALLGLATLGLVLFLTRPGAFEPHYQLQAIFPDGICDWTQGDVHREGYQGTWLSFGPSEVNRAW